MPKTKEEKETLKEFGKEYKDPKKAKEVYYALRNKNKKFDRSQGGGFSDKADGFSIMTGKGDLILTLEEGEVQLLSDGDVVIKAEHEGHLVSSEGKKHLPTESNGKPNHRLMGAAWAALHEGYRGNKYEGPNKSQAISKLKRMYEREGMSTPSGKASMEDKSIKQNRSEYPANEEGFTTSMGPVDLAPMVRATKKSSPLWWVERLSKLPQEAKARLIKSAQLAPAVTWWNDRIDTLTNHLGNHEEDDKEDHMRS